MGIYHKECGNEITKYTANAEVIGSDKEEKS
jgi:hypothetical protein